MKKLYSLLALFLFIANPGSAQNSETIWAKIAENSFTVKDERRILPLKYSTVRSNFVKLQTILSSAPLEFTNRAKNSPLIIRLPSPSGELLKYSVVEYKIMESALEARYPEFKAYIVQGIDDPYSSGTLDITSKGFHAMILTPNGDYFIDPYSMNEREIYISYFKSDLINKNEFECLTPAGLNSEFIRNNSRISTGDQLRTYRLACAATGEYTAFHGGTWGDALSAIITAINRVNGVYQREISVRMTLVANNTSIIYTNAATDPYSNFNGGAMLGQNQTTIDNNIGNGNYDIGHVFSTGGGGVAYLNSVCVTGLKAGGVTGLDSPIGDPFYIDFVAHEMGHQFGGNHSFNSLSGNCNGNRNASTAYEPGSGSTIMGYAGICGGDDLQPHSDAFFHTGNYDEFVNYTQFGNGNSCPVITATGNTPPSVTVYGGFTIPISTPFQITGSATDIETPGSITYCWEEYDLGPAGSPGVPVGNAPIFRSFNPTISPTRTFPKLSDLINNTTTIGELLPSYSRNLHFELTARDNNAGGGGVAYGAPYFVTVTSSAGPFIVTQPNTSVLWNANNPQTVTWNVANTNAAPINCGTVNIKLSLDGGLTFPTVLVSNTPNDGSQSVTLPNINNSQARIRIEAFGNIFFDISNTNFTIQSFLCEEVTSVSFPPAGWNVEFTGTNKWSRNDVSAYGAGTGSIRFEFYDAYYGVVQSLTTSTFEVTGADSYLTFDNAYAPYDFYYGGPDTLVIQTSTNSGSTYTTLRMLIGRGDGTGELNTAPPTTNSFTPENHQWRPKLFALPAGINKLRFTARSGFGNNLYLDNICIKTLPLPVTNTVGVIPEGMYTSAYPKVTLNDTIRVYLYRTDFPNVVVDSAISIFDDAGYASNLVFNNALSGTYYKVVKHRNTIETWSKAGGEAYARGFNAGYDFVYPGGQAYANNQKLINPSLGYYGMFSGDVNQDGTIDATDLALIDNDAANFVTGYVKADLTGDDFVDATDLAMADNNAANFVSVIRP